MSINPYSSSKSTSSSLKADISPTSQTDRRFSAKREFEVAFEAEQLFQRLQKDYEKAIKQEPFTDDVVIVSSSRESGSPKQHPPTSPPPLFPLGNRAERRSCEIVVIESDTEEGQDVCKQMCTEVTPALTPTECMPQPDDSGIASRANSQTPVETEIKLNSQIDDCSVISRPDSAEDDNSIEKCCAEIVRLLIDKVIAELGEQERSLEHNVAGKLDAPSTACCSSIQKKGDLTTSNKADKLKAESSSKTDYKDYRFHPYTKPGPPIYHPTNLPLTELVQNRTRFRNQPAPRNFVPPAMNPHRPLVIATALPRFDGLKIGPPPELQLGAADAIWMGGKRKKLPRFINPKDYSFRLERDYQNEYIWSEQEKLAWNRQDVAGRWRYYPCNHPCSSLW